MFVKGQPAEVPAEAYQNTIILDVLCSVHFSQLGSNWTKFAAGIMDDRWQRSTTTRNIGLGYEHVPPLP